MKYNLCNEEETANLLMQIINDRTVGQRNVGDFQWFITTVQEAIGKKLKVRFRYNASVNLNDVDGIITSSDVEYSTDELSETKITITFINNATGKKEEVIYIFNAEYVEENTNSQPRDFMKYYLYNNQHDILIGFTFYYK